MIRFPWTASLLTAGGLLTSPGAFGQDTPVATPSAGAATSVPPGAPAAEPALGPAPNAKDPFFAYYSYYQPRQQDLANALDPLEANFGLTLADVDDALRAQLEIPAGEGVVVVAVKPGSLAEQAGLKLNDVLTRLGDQKAQSWGQVKQILLGLGKEALEVKLIRRGKASRMSLVGPEHGFPAEAAEYWIGTPVSPVDATLRAHLPTLPADAGLVVNDVVKGSPADQAALRKGDILVAMDGKPLKNADALIAQIQASQGKRVPLQVLRAGKPGRYDITPARRAHPSIINVKVLPDAPLTFQVVRPNMAIQVEPPTARNPYVSELAEAKPADSKAPAAANYTLFAPYTGVIHDPYPNINYTFSNANQPLTQNLVPYTPRNTPATPDPTTARIEGQLKEVIAKLEAITKALEALKKPAGK